MAGVGPIRGEGAVEALDLPVGLGPVGAGELVDDVTEGGGEKSGPVTGSVVGDDPQHGDAVRGVERIGAFPEPGGGFLFLVGQDLGVDEPGMIIDRGVQKAMANPGAPVSPPGLPAEGAVPAAVGDAAEFLHIHVHQVARILPFVTERFWFSDRQAGVQIDVAQERHLVSVEYLRHCRLGQVQVEADAVWPPPPGETQRDDPPLGATIRARR